MNSFKRLLLTIILFISIFLIPSIAIGQTDNVPSPTIKYESVNMKDGFRYIIKRVEEKITLSYLSVNSQKKLDYYEKLLNVRLAELKFVVDNKDIGNIQVASQRYFTTAGQLTNFLILNNTLFANKEVVKQLFADHIKIIEILKKSYKDTTAEWRFLRDDANYLIDYSVQLK